MPWFIERLDFQDPDSAVSETLEHILELFPSLLQRQHLALLAQKFASPWAESLTGKAEGWFDEDKLANFTNLITSYGNIVIEDILVLRDENSRKIGDILFKLIENTGSPGVQDMVAPTALGFWMSYVEFVQNIDRDFADKKEPGWMKRAYGRIFDLVWICWSKIQWPLDGSADTWDSEEIMRFKAFRTDVQDLVQTTYIVFGVELLNQFVEKAIALQGTGSWAQIEACLFMLNALVDSSAPHEFFTNSTLSVLFSSRLFTENDEAWDVIKLKRARLRMISLYTNFFEERPEHLPPVLNYLFRSLQDPEVDTMAAQAIFTICSACREALIPELSNFLQLYLALLLDHDSKTEVKGKQLSALKLRPFRGLLVCSACKLVLILLSREVDGCNGVDNSSFAFRRRQRRASESLDRSREFQLYLWGGDFAKGQ